MRLFKLCWRCLWISVLAPSVIGAASCSAPPPDPSLPLLTYQVVNAYPHSASAYTQGLLFHKGFLYESTGLYGASSLRKVDLATGEVLERRDLQSQFFGEGLALVGERLIQLTWKEGTGFVYDLETFALTGDFRYTGEGWGLAFDGTRLVMSDGTATLRYLDPDTFAETGSVEVRDANGPVRKLNELEFIDGELYANVYMTDRVVRIDPATGTVSAWIDLSGLLTPGEQAALQSGDVLNGIAHDPATGRIFVTGKRWPRLFEITLHPAP